MSQVEKEVFARFMEAYAGFVEHTDDQIGRLVTYLKKRGVFEDTLIVSWPERIQNTGLREQFVDVIDITPTVLDYLGIDAPAVFDGVDQMPLQGASLRHVFENPGAPAARDTQFFELWGSRSIYHQGSKAVAFHKDGTSFDDDYWELYYQPNDFTESNNLAEERPEKLKELQALWWKEAEKNEALPFLEALGGRKRSYDQI